MRFDQYSWTDDEWTSNTFNSAYFLQRSFWEDSNNVIALCFNHIFVKTNFETHHVEKKLKRNSIFFLFPNLTTTLLPFLLCKFLILSYEMQDKFRIAVTSNKWQKSDITNNAIIKIKLNYETQKKINMTNQYSLTVSHKIVMIDSIENKRTTNPWAKQKNMK